MTLLKQPLLHFLLLGALLFVLFELTAGRTDENNRTVVVDRERLLEFMQFRSKAFDEQRFNQILDSMPDERKRQLIDDYIREEVLYREALALGLEANDYIIRQRLVQKVEYLARGYETPRDVDVQAYYEENLSRYLVPASTTFTHVFVSYDNHESREQARQVLAGLRQELLSKNVGFAEALSFGERFPFHKNYVERTPEFVASHFGQAFADQVFSLPLNAWSEPIESAYGLHLVLISSRSEERAAPFEEVAQNVQFDAEQAAVRDQMETAIDEIADRYEIIIEL